MIKDRNCQSCDNYKNEYCSVVDMKPYYPEKGCDYFSGKLAIEALEQESILDKIKKDVKEWYWEADKQELAKDPCVVDAMIDLFIRTIAKYQAESEEV